MLPRKKLEFYAKKHGIEYFAAVKMTAEDLVSICDTIGSKQFGLSDCGGRLSTLIDCVIGDAKYNARIMGMLTAKGYKPSEDIFAIRILDYAAEDVMSAYAALHPAKE